MKIRNISIRSRLIIGFAIIIMMLAFLGHTALNDISEATKVTEDIYNHPLTVSNAVRDINANVIAIHRSMKDVALAQNEVEMNKARILVDQYEDEVFEKFEVVFSQFLGDMRDVENAHKSFTDWKEIREEVIFLWLKGSKEDAIAITKGKGADHVQKVLGDIQVMIDFASLKADEFYKQTKINESRAYNRMIYIILAIALISIIVLISMYRSIVIPIKSININAKKIEAGDLEVENPTGSGDELNELAVSFNNMTLAIKSRNTILSGLAEISTSLHGLLKLDEFTDSILTKFVDLTSAQVATFFNYQETTGDFQPINAIGVSLAALKSFSMDDAPGEFSHVIKNKNVYILDNIREDNYLKFESVIGKLLPKQIVSIPVIDQNNVAAIISIGKLDSFSEESINIFKQSQSIISSSYSTLIASHMTSEYAKKLSRSNEILENQARELQLQAIELKQQSDELKLTSDNLHEQNIELELQSKEVEEANKLKSEFLSNMSHELRTPLNSINALSKVLIAQSATKLSVDEKNYLKIIERNGQRLLSLINDILDLSKVEAGKMDIQLKTFSLGTALNFTIESLQPLADEKGLEINFISEENLKIESDEGRLHQVFTNIIGNAIKFTDKGEINIRAELVNGTFVIEVQDTGIGIDKDVIPYIFSEFRQADGSTSRKYEGTGLGLAIAKKILLALNGNITCHSEVGMGSTFTIEIPEHWDYKLAKPFNLNIETGPYPGEKTILVVDDDKRFAEQLGRKIKSEGFNVIYANTGKDAIKLAIQHIPFAITLDIVMPEMDGWEVLQYLNGNKATSDIPVIIVSGSDESETSSALGAIGYLQKPIEENALLHEIRKVNQSAKKIVIIDDNDVDILNLSKAISNDRFKIKSFNSGKDCLKHLSEEIPDILILDLMMPGMDGFEVIKEIRTNDKFMGLPIIIVTAKDLSTEEKQFLNRNATKILSKSAVSGNLASEVRDILFNLYNRSISKMTKIKPDILLIEDNEAAVIQVKNELEKAGFRVAHAHSGDRALELIQLSIPDGIILDLMMPGMNGFEVLEKIRGDQNTKNIPVLILTAKTLSKRDLSRLSSNNVSQLIQKGDINIANLIGKVNSMLDISKPLDISNIKMPSDSDSSLKTKDKVKSRILIIEDNPDNRDTIKVILGSQFDILEAEDGITGLKMIKETVPDVVLLDIALPKLDGFGVIKQVRNDKKIKHIPVIAVTAKAMKNDEEEILEAGCDAYISKPIDDEKLMLLVNSYLQ